MMGDNELTARIGQMMEAAGSGPSEAVARLPDEPRYSISTTYPYGIFKSSDMYLWLDKIYKISRIKSVRAGEPAAPQQPFAPVLTKKEAAALEKAPTPQAAVSFAEAVKRKKMEAATKAVPAPEREEEITHPPPAKPVAMEMEEAEIEVPEEKAAPQAEEQELEIEEEGMAARPAAAPARAPARAREAAAEEEAEIESKGDIGEINVKIDEIKKEEEEELAHPFQAKAKKGEGAEGPSRGRLRISYLDEHEAPRISAPDMLSWDIEKKAEEEIKGIEENAKSSTYQDKVDITKRLLELTKMKISEKDLERKRKIDSEIMLLKDRMKGEKVKTADLPALVRHHLSSEVESAAGELAESLDSISNEYKSKYENAKKIAGDDSGLISRIEIQFVDDSNQIAEGYSRILSDTVKLFVAFHSRKVDSALAKNIFDKKDADAMKASIRQDYPEKFSSVRSRIDLIRAKKQEIIKSSDALSAVVAEISGMKEAELLHELGARDRKAFLLYIKGEMSKSSAIAHARREIAKNRGLPDEMVDRYFPKGEET
jgi:hypothetical protein